MHWCMISEQCKFCVLVCYINPALIWQLSSVSLKEFDPFQKSINMHKLTALFGVEQRKEPCYLYFSSLTLIRNSHIYAATLNCIHLMSYCSLAARWWAVCERWNDKSMLHDFVAPVTLTRGIQHRQIQCEPVKQWQAISIHPRVASPKSGILNWALR